MTYHNAIKYIKNAPQVRRDDPRFSHMRLLCEQLDEPQKRLSYLRLAGSNGKTLCGGMLTSVFKHTALSVGYLAMPVREDVRQNILIDATPITMEEIVSYTEAVAHAVAAIHAKQAAAAEEQEGGMEASPSEPFFLTSSEILLAIALLAFRAHRCRLCLIESDHASTDPSHVLSSPFATVICGTIPHDERQEIARIRSYVTRGTQEIVSAPQNADAHRVLADTCASVNCRLTLPLKSALEVTRLSLRETEFLYKGRSYTVNLCGRFQVANALVAIETLEMLIRRGYEIPDEAITKGLSTLSIPSKFEILSAMPFIIADSTHTPIAIETVSDSMAEFRNHTGDHVRLCLPAGDLAPHYEAALAARGYTVERMILLAENGETQDGLSCPVTLCKTIKQATKEALRDLGSDGFLLISGTHGFSAKMRYEILATLGF